MVGWTESVFRFTRRLLKVIFLFLFCSPRGREGSGVRKSGRRAVLLICLRKGEPKAVHTGGGDAQNRISEDLFLNEVGCVNGLVLEGCEQDVSSVSARNLPAWDGHPLVNTWLRWGVCILLSPPLFLPVVVPEVGGRAKPPTPAVDFK